MRIRRSICIRLVSQIYAIFIISGRKGVQIIVETHSDHIYNAVRKYIHTDVIETDKVTIYFFERKENGTSVPVLIPIDEDGKAQDQRDGFFDQTKKDLDVILGW